MGLGVLGGCWGVERFCLAFLEGLGLNGSEVLCFSLTRALVPSHQAGNIVIGLI